MHSNIDITSIAHRIENPLRRTSEHIAIMDFETFTQHIIRMIQEQIVKGASQRFDVIYTYVYIIYIIITVNILNVSNFRLDFSWYGMEQKKY